MIWLGVFGSSLAYLIYFRLVHVLGATRMSLITYVMPIVGIVLGVLVLDETLDLRTIVGTAIILGGVGLVNGKRGNRRLFGRAPATPPEPAAPATPAGTSRAGRGTRRIADLTGPALPRRALSPRAPAGTRPARSARPPRAG